MLTEHERREIQYVSRQPNPVWGGPERRGDRPMHELHETVGKYMRLGLIEHRPGEGYVITDKGRVAAFQ